MLFGTSLVKLIIGDESIRLANKLKNTKMNTKWMRNERAAKFVTFMLYSSSCLDPLYGTASEGIYHKSFLFEEKYSQTYNILLS